MPTDLDVLLVGSLMVELTPRPPGVPLRAVRELAPLPAGAAANFAISLARLGPRVGFLSRVGADEWGQWLIWRLQQEGMDTSLIQPIPGQLSPVSFCWMDRRGQKTFYFYRFRGTCDPMAELAAADMEAANVGRARLFDFTEATIRAEPTRSAVLRGAELAREASRTVCYAVNYRPPLWAECREEAAKGLELVADIQRRAWALADVVLLNEEEASLLTGAADPPAAARAIAALGPSVVAVTAGKRGALLLADATEYQIAPRQVQVRYDIGAGDAFHAGLVAALLSGMPPPQMGRFAADAAALKISRDPETGNLPTRDEVLRLMQTPP